MVRVLLQPLFVMPVSCVLGIAVWAFSEARRPLWPPPGWPLAAGLLAFRLARRLQRRAS